MRSKGGSAGWICGLLKTGRLSVWPASWRSSAAKPSWPIRWSAASRSCTSCAHQYRSHYHAIDTLFHTGELNPDLGMRPHANLFQGGGALKTIDFSRFKPPAGQPRSDSPRADPPAEEEGAVVKTLLETRDGVARDPEVYFDGKKIVFALRRNAAEDYHIWEIKADGAGLRQLTSAEGVSDVDPMYLPDDSIVFSSTREPKYNMCSRDHGANLFRMEADGANIHQIGKNNLFDNQPSLMPDGRILYAALGIRGPQFRRRPRPVDGQSGRHEPGALLEEQHGLARGGAGRADHPRHAAGGVHPRAAPRSPVGGDGRNRPPPGPGGTRRRGAHLAAASHRS